MASNTIRNSATNDNDQHIPPVATIERRGMTQRWCCLITTFDGGLGQPGQDCYHLEKSLEHGNPIVSYDRITRKGTSCKDYVESLENAFPLPPMSHGAKTTFIRWHMLSSYRKLFITVLVLNLLAQAIFLSVRLREPSSSSSSRASVDNAATAASCNFCIGILFRNEHIVNLLFRLICATPHWVPLPFRRRLAKVYCYGGVHSGCNVSGTVWYFIFWALFTWKSQESLAEDVALSVTTGLIVAFLVIILVFAYPTMRQKYHDCFELTHRFLGWCAIACFWAQFVLLTLIRAKQSSQSLVRVFFSAPTTWFLSTITLSICYPWTRLRLRRTVSERLSKQALRLRFDYTTMDTCHGIRLTDCPLKETHGFATIPNVEKNTGFSVLISAAGDWTRDIIRDPPSHIWVRGAPIIGVARIALMFRKVVMIATGTGIGPCLSFLQARPDYPTRVIWSARTPEETYDAETINAVLYADPAAIILDSKETGRRNLLPAAFALYKESNAEAVIVIANPTVVRMVVGGLESRGIPAYGPIFDS